MKLTLSVLAIFAGTVATAQEFHESDLNLQTKYANYVFPYIFSDGTAQLSIDGYVYNFDSEGNPIGKPTQMPEVSREDEWMYYYWNNFNNDSETMVTYSSDGGMTESPKNATFVIESMTPQGKVREKFEFADELDLKRNLCSVIRNDKSSQAFRQFQLEDGTAYGVQIFMSISDKSHPELSKFKDDVFHTFLHLVRFDPKTKQVEISNHMIDKITFPRGGRNSADARMAGVINNKLIIVYETYVSEEAKGLYDVMGSAKKKKLTFWSLDLLTKEEKQLYEYNVDMPEEVKQYDIQFNELSKYGMIVMDCSWTERESTVINGKEETGYSSHHKLLTISSELEFTETSIDVPEKVMLLAETKPAMFMLDVAPDKTLRYCNVIRSTEEAEKRKDNKEHYAVYMFQADESGEISHSYNSVHLDVISQSELGIFTTKRFEEEELEKMYGNIFEPDDFCKLCHSQIKSSARIVNNELITFTVQYLPEHTCGAMKCEIEKIMIRIGRIPLSE
ncbi:MAG TPA: hypothetical protein VK151_17650 [Fluviicola sp.]|nr:hypothetical protein [Fluviicola sp.]